MNSITNLLDLEDPDIIISDVQIQGQVKTITLETPPVPRFCPMCGYRMHSRGVKKRTIRHPILQDGYSLIIVLKQRRWRCTNSQCLYETGETFRFVNRNRRTTNATDMLIVNAYRNLMETSASIAKRFRVSDTHAHEVFDRYAKLDRLPLTDAISVDEVLLDADDNCRYALVIQDFHTGDPIDSSVALDLSSSSGPASASRSPATTSSDPSLISSASSSVWRFPLFLGWQIHLPHTPYSPPGSEF